MSEDCNQTCSSCGSECGERKEPQDLFVKPNELSSIKKVIGIVSGKGGVGKSLVTSLLAVTMNRRGHHAAILDADITGPSIPKAFGVTGKVTSDGQGLYPPKSFTGIDVMSTNLILANDTDPVIWRGPVIANTVKQFWQDLIWKNVDYMFIDMPPGTGDVPLTVFQSIKVDGIIIVTSPQELVSMIVTKAVKMAEMMNVPIIGLVENMAYFKCPGCEQEHKIFGDSHIDQIAKQHDLPVLARIPLDPQIAAACDKGQIEAVEFSWFDRTAELLEKDETKGETKDEAKAGEKMKIALPSRGSDIDDHFGHCEYFTVFTINDKQEIISQETVDSPAGCGCKSNIAAVLAEMGVRLMLAGNMGEGAVNVLRNSGIEVVRGCSGNVKENVRRWLAGSLADSGDSCREHEHGCHA